MTLLKGPDSGVQPRSRLTSRRTLMAGTAWTVPLLAATRAAPVLAASPDVAASLAAGQFSIYTGTCTTNTTTGYLRAVQIDVTTTRFTQGTDYWTLKSPDGDSTTGPSAACYTWFTPRRMGLATTISRSNGNFSVPTRDTARDTATHYAYTSCSLRPANSGFVWNATNQEWTTYNNGITSQLATTVVFSMNLALGGGDPDILGCPCNDPTMVFGIQRDITYKGVVYSDTGSNMIGCGTATMTHI